MANPVEEAEAGWVWELRCTSRLPYSDLPWSHSVQPILHWQDRRICGGPRGFDRILPIAADEVRRLLLEKRRG